MATVSYQATGRRKTAVASVRLMAGGGTMVVNGKPMRQYLTKDDLMLQAQKPLEVTGMLGKVESDLNPVLIANQGQEPGEEHDVLINLAAEVPRFFSRFERVAECVDKDENARQLSRNRFRYYREHGYPLNNHDID